MKFFLEEILENDAVRACMTEDSPLAETGRKIAQQIVETGAKVKMEPGMLQVYVLAYFADYALKKNSARGIPKEITVDTLKDVNIWLDNYGRRYGMLGLAQISWLSLHYVGNLFCLGRLQFILRPAPEEVPSGGFVVETHIPRVSL